MRDKIVSACCFIVSLSCASEPLSSVAPVAEPEPAPAVQPAPTPPPPAEPTAEEKAQTAAAEKLAHDVVEMETQAANEAQRWTPEMHGAAGKLATAKYYSVRGAFAAIKNSAHRLPTSASRDVQRHPVETLEFFGLQPNMTVLEYGPGEGWYTEILAPTLAARGKLIATNTDPSGAATERSTMYGRRFQMFLDKAPEIYGKVQVAVVDTKNPTLSLDGTVDMALVIRGMHGWENNGVVKPWLTQIYKALKPGGVLGVVQHRAKAGADPVESAKKGYLPEQWVIDQVVAAGFALSKKSELNKNDKDSTDHPEGVWTLPPTLRLGATDREKYVAIGESDRMTLRFVKPKQ